MIRLRIALTLATLIVLAACAPQAQPATTPATTPSGAAAGATQTIAEIAHHRMEIGRLQTGAYTTNVLVDIEIPRGVRWTVLEFAEDDYLLRFTHDEVPGALWLVEPDGVRTEDAS